MKKKLINRFVASGFARLAACALLSLAGAWSARADSATSTTLVPVPYSWLLSYYPGCGSDYEAAANATAANGRKVWTCFALGVDPTNPSDDFRITKFWMDGDRPMFEYSHTKDGSNKSFEEYINKLGKEKLTDTWKPVPPAGSPAFRFFTAEVVYPGGTSIADSSDKVRLWENGPYWATTNIGAANPEEPGYYFWWGDTVGYWREGDKWVATDGSSSNFSFESSNVPTCGKDAATLQSEGWITADGVLAPEHDAAQAQWGGDWRMPTDQELSALRNNCNWTWATQNGVNGYIVSGVDAYSSNSIFLPCAGDGYWTSLSGSGSSGSYWSSVPNSGYDYAYELYFESGDYYSWSNYNRYCGQSVRPVQGPTK